MAEQAKCLGDLEAETISNYKIILRVKVTDVDTHILDLLIEGIPLIGQRDGQFQCLEKTPEEIIGIQAKIYRQIYENEKIILNINGNVKIQKVYIEN